MRYFACFMLFVLCVSCENQEPFFTSLNSSRTNISFQNKLTSTPDLNILNYLYYYNGAGVTAADFNNDGLTDLYFTANQTADKLYLNLGDFEFKDITEQSGIDNSSNWTTGVTSVDINNDGLLDLYICKIGNHNSISGQNLLYVNQGLKDNIPVFKEEAEAYGLAVKSYATQSVFFDYDLDNDLDMFLLNHSVYPNQNYGKGSSRLKADSLSGDKLYENINGTYVDVTSQSGIFQGKIGYGLGVSVQDINNDGYPDIYVGNDFFENDYLYINQKNKTFKETISEDISKLGHTTHFSMGNALDDLNNDGLIDIISLDMLPEDLKYYKTSGLEYPYQTYEYYLKNGYAPQFMQNTFHLNNGNGNFSEISYLSGIAATEWSWSPIVADFDNDSNKDLYITNGILGATNDMDFINFISNEHIQKQLGAGMSEKELALTAEIPKKKIQNYFYRNNGDNTFKNVTQKWSPTGPSYSNGGVYADLDNDGDLDIVINNVNETAYVLENTLNESIATNNFLKIKFKGHGKNIFGIGAKVRLYTNDQIIVEENYTTSGYLSSVEPKIHLGLGIVNRIDSLHIIWPNASFQTIKNLEANQEIEVDIKNASGNFYEKFQSEQSKLLTNNSPFIDFKHYDQTSIEFNRDPLVPFASTNLGPHIAVADVNNDSLEDLFICGGKSQSSQLFLQKENGGFTPTQNNLFKDIALSEDTYSLFFDANGDAYVDLLVVSGGNEFSNGINLNPRFYRNNEGTFVQDSLQFKGVEVNASTAKAVDIDKDGDLDISITSNLVPREFGITPKQYIFENDGKGNFNDITSSFSPDFQNIGNVQDINWTDINNDGFEDAIVTGYWMPVTIFINDGKQLHIQKNNTLSNSNGWWNTVNTADFDKDGDIDIIAGNWGLNTRLQASAEGPITLYSNDYDDNGTIDPVITSFYQGEETPFASKDELAKQMPFLNKKYLSYKDFANAKFSDLLPADKIKEAYKKQVYELASCYFENLGNNTFKKHQLPLITQISSVNDITIEDFNNDGYLDVFLVGNNYEISTQLGKLDASHGQLLLNDKNGFFKVHKNPDFDVSGPARHIQKIRVNGEIYFMVSINNDAPIFLKKDK